MKWLALRNPERRRERRNLDTQRAKATMSCVDVPTESYRSVSGLGSSGCSGLLANVSIVIPVGPEDESWRSLIGDLLGSGTDAELLLVGARAEPTDVNLLRAHRTPPRDIRWQATTAGRGHQMNVGATLSTRPFLWFLHADSRVGVDALFALERSLHSHPRGLHYFDLAFQDDGPGFVRLNAWGVRVRSDYLRLPFGDQAFCMSRETFQRLGRFDESAAYGEDHLLVWRAHRQRVPLHRVGALIATSARKYRTSGWLRTTLVHGWRTWRQAVPQVVKFFWNRSG